MANAIDNIKQAAAMIRGAGYLVALSGAGLSAGSGIPTYRGVGGLWTQHGTPPLLSYQEFARDPAEWWRARMAAEEDPLHPVYQMKQAVDAAKPNAGHLALAELERMGILRSTITQNVDNLHGEAGSRALAGDSWQPEPAAVPWLRPALSTRRLRSVGCAARVR